MKIKARVKIGELIEALGCNNPGQENIAPETLKINTPLGYKKVEAIRKTQLNPEWEVEAVSGLKTIVADKHKFETKDGPLFDKDRKWQFVDSLKTNDFVFTENGWDQIKICKYNGKNSYMYDFQVSETNSYYADKFHGHNSIFLPNFGIKSLLGGLNVVHYTLEMSEERLGMRYDAITSGLIMKELNGHPDEIKKKYDTIQKITKARLKMKEFPTGMASVMDIEAHLENLKLHEDFVPDVLIVDYGDIMRSSHKAANLYEEQGWIFREMRGLAVKKNVIVITATQSNRDSLGADGATKEIIGMNNTADSMEKNRIIDALFTITQTRSEKDSGQINLYAAKNRNGESNVYCQFNINYGNMKITEALLGSNQNS